ncbi:hypothetical protein GLYMA_03G177300v4 [Glycine max]|nr:hypothetical protein GLYMA_03G177300v4 [Glycine max]
MAMVGLERRLESLILLPSQGRAGPRKNTTSFSKLFNYLTEIGRKLKILLVQKQLFRSHAQKYFLKVQKNGAVAHVPPPRPKRKASHPYPQKASKNVLLPLPASMVYVSSTSALPPGYVTWDENSLLMNSGSNKSVPCNDELAYLLGNEADIGSKGITRIGHSSLSGVGNSTRNLPATEMAKQGKQAQVIHGLPDFAEVYSFIGSVFDPDTKGHVQKLKEMDPINFETVLLLMKNLTVNLSSPDFEPVVSFKVNLNHDYMQYV